MIITHKMIILLLKNSTTYWWNSTTTVIFHDFPGLENSFLKFYDFPQLSRMRVNLVTKVNLVTVTVCEVNHVSDPAPDLQRFLR